MINLRTDTLLWNQYKIVDLKLDTPFCKIYRVNALIGSKSFLLIDYEKDSSPEAVKEETQFWISSVNGIFPDIFQMNHENEVFSFIVPDFHGIPIRSFISMGAVELPEEKVFSLMPDLIQLSKKMFQVSFAPGGELLLDRISLTSDQHLILLPALLSAVFLKKGEEIPTFARADGESRENQEVKYVQTFGRTLCYLLTQVFPKGESLPEKAEANLKEDLRGFLQAVLQGEFKTFEKMESAFSFLVKKRSQKALQPQTAERVSKRSWFKEAQTKAVDFALPVIWGFKIALDAAVGFFRLLFFVSFLASSYYWGLIKKIIKGCRRLFQKFRSLTWEDIRKFSKGEIQRAQFDLKNIQFSIALLAPVDDAELLQFTRHLATMLNAGVSFAQSLKILHSQAINLRFKNSVADLYYEVVQKGHSLSTAMRQTKHIFSELYINMVAAGEVTGKVGEILHQVADYLERTRLLKQKVKAAVTYPIIICIVCFAVFSIFVYYVLPNLMGVFKGMNIPYPTPTKILIFIVNFAHSPLVMLIAIITAIILFFPLKFFLTSLIGRERIDQYKIRLPLFGAVYKKVLLTRFCSTLGVLVQCGIPLLNSLETTGRASGNEFFNTIVQDMIEKVRIGESLSNIIQENLFFPPLVSSMVQIGEESGSLEVTLLKAANIYQGEVEHLLQQLLALLEPLLLAVMGFVVGFVVLAVFEPIYSIVQGIHTH
jgi:type IV pilus assembly protein PilC